MNIDLIRKTFGRLTVLRQSENDKHGCIMFLCKCDCGKEILVRKSRLIHGNTNSCGCLRLELFVKDITGQKFGRLEVLSRSDNNIKGQAKWLCRCDCGKEVVILGSKLRNKHTQSCGCYGRQRTSETHLKDLTGRKFERLLVLKRAENNANGDVMWLCQCDCGNSKNISTAALKNENTRSCGCLMKETSITNAILLNKDKMADLTGKKFGKLFVLDRAKNYNNGNSFWRCKCDCGREHYSMTNDLTTNKVKSCGCSKRVDANDLVGQNFGRLTVLNYEGRDSYSRHSYICKCSCGKIKIISRNSLIRNDGKDGTKSCGCLGRERGANNPAWKGGRWKTKEGYVEIWTEEKHTPEHRYVMEKHLNRKLTKNETIHHINGVKDDNRIENLELRTLNNHLPGQSVEERKRSFVSYIKQYCTTEEIEKIINELRQKI